MASSEQHGTSLGLVPLIATERNESLSPGTALRAGDRGTMLRMWEYSATACIRAWGMEFRALRAVKG